MILFLGQAKIGYYPSSAQKMVLITIYFYLPYYFALRINPDELTS